jgi:hypothetical protein
MSGRPAYLLVEEVMLDDLFVISKTQNSEFKYRLRNARGITAVERYQFAAAAYN